MLCVCERVRVLGWWWWWVLVLKLLLHSSLIFISSQDTVDAKRKHQSLRCPPCFLSFKLKWYLIAVLQTRCVGAGKLRRIILIPAITKKMSALFQHTSLKAAFKGDFLGRCRAWSNATYWEFGCNYYCFKSLQHLKLDHSSYDTKLCMCPNLVQESNSALLCKMTDWVTPHCFYACIRVSYFLQQCSTVEAFWRCFSLDCFLFTNFQSLC